MKEKKLVLLSTRIISTFSLCFLIHPFSSQAKLLDKVAAVFDKEVITLSQLERAKKNYAARRLFAPQKYQKENPSTQDLADYFLQTLLIRDKLSSLNRSIDDISVQKEIKNRIQQTNMTRSDLKNFLQQNNLTSSEFSAIFKENMEFSLFNALIILPLINISEKEIRQEFLKAEEKGLTKTYAFDVIDYNFPKKLNTDQKKKMSQAVKASHNSQQVVEGWAELGKVELKQVEEESLNPDLAEVLRKTPLNSFSKPLVLGETTHIFYLKKRKLLKSQSYTKAKNSIQASIYEKRFKKVSEEWYAAENSKHFTQKNI